nr:hypothetical protein [Halomicroarcula sp. GDY20]
MVLISLPATAAGAAFGGLSQQSVDPDVVVLTADVAGDGTAQWTVAYRVRLDSDNDTRAFEELQRDVRANRSAYTDRFGARMRGTARTAENATGREMAVENVTVATRTETFGQSYGVVTYRFRWTNFAAVDGDRLRVGDAIAGLFLDSETSLTLSWPSSYSAVSVSPGADERDNTSATWRGQEQFATDEPRVVLARQAPDRPGDGPPLGLLGGAALTVFALAAAGYAFRDRLPIGGGEATGDGAGEATGGTDGAGAGAAAAGGAGDPTEPPEELLSNEEQVLKLLREHGGRIKQQRVASELDWTDAKTSQVVGGLRDEDELETFRIGRENVVTLPDTDISESDGGDGDDR